MNIETQVSITAIINRYFAALDDRTFDIATMRGIFSEDGKIIRPNGVVTSGAQSIGESHRESLSRFRATQHIASGYIVTAAGECEAAFRANLVAMHLWAEGHGEHSIDPNENYFLAGGVVTGRVSLQNDGWHISEITNNIVWRRGVGFQQMLQTK